MRFCLDFIKKNFIWRPLWSTLLLSVLPVISLRIIEILGWKKKHYFVSLPSSSFFYGKVGTTSFVSYRSFIFPNSFNTKYTFVTGKRGCLYFSSCKVKTGYPTFWNLYLNHFCKVPNCIRRNKQQYISKHFKFLRSIVRSTWKLTNIILGK